MAVKKGDFVRVEYTGKIHDTGEIFDTTNQELARESEIYVENKKYGAIPIVVGAGHLLKGLDKALVGMEESEKKAVDIAPEDGFGIRDPKLIQLIPIREFHKQNIKPEVGMKITLDGNPARIQSVSGGRVRVDFNHELAGKTLQYEIEVKEVIKDDIEKIRGIIELHYPNPNIEPGKHQIKIEDGKAIIYLDDLAKFDNKITLVKFRIAREIWDNLGINRVEFVDVFEKKVKEEEKAGEK